jgi:hypothetical protein
MARPLCSVYIYSTQTCHPSNDQSSSDLRSTASRPVTMVWTTGRWMTERAGGSSVLQTETLATYSPESSSGPESLSTNSEKGTGALPNAELELKGVCAYLIGEGVAALRRLPPCLILPGPNSAVSAVGFWGRGLGVFRAFARCRKVGSEAS